MQGLLAAVVVQREADVSWIGGVCGSNAENRGDMRASAARLRLAARACSPLLLPFWPLMAHSGSPTKVSSGKLQTAALPRIERAAPSYALAA